MTSRQHTINPLKGRPDFSFDSIILILQYGKSCKSQNFRLVTVEECPSDHDVYERGGKVWSGKQSGLVFLEKAGENDRLPEDLVEEVDFRYDFNLLKKFNGLACRICNL